MPLNPFYDIRKKMKIDPNELNAKKVHDIFNIKRISLSKTKNASWKKGS